MIYRKHDIYRKENIQNIIMDKLGLEDPLEVKTVSSNGDTNRKTNCISVLLFVALTNLKKRKKTCKIQANEKLPECTFAKISSRSQWNSKSFKISVAEKMFLPKLPKHQRKNREN